MIPLWWRFSGVLLTLWVIIMAVALLIGRALPSDGQLLYLVDIGANEARLRALDLRHRVSAWIVSKNDDEPFYVGTSLLVSPDGSQIAYQTARNNTLEVHLVNVDGSNIRRIEQNGVYEPIGWLPDSVHLLLYVRGSDYLDVLDVSHMNVVSQIHLPSRVCSAFNISLSPNGQYIAFQSDEEVSTAQRCDGVQIHNINDDRSLYVDLQASSQLWISWSNNSQSLAAWDSTGVDLIFDATHADSTNIPDLFPAYGSPNVLWSPDNTRLAFVGYFTWSTGSYLLPLQPEIGEAAVLIPEDLLSRSLVWLPSRDEIAFIAQHRNSRELYLSNADGSELRRVTYNNEHEYNLVWLP